MHGNLLNKVREGGKAGEGREGKVSQREGKGSWYSERDIYRVDEWTDGRVEGERDGRENKISSMYFFVLPFKWYKFKLQFWKKRSWRYI